MRHTEAWRRLRRDGAAYGVGLMREANRTDGCGQLWANIAIAALLVLVAATFACAAWRVLT